MLDGKQYESFTSAKSRNAEDFFDILFFYEQQQNPSATAEKGTLNQDLNLILFVRRKKKKM